MMKLVFTNEASGRALRLFPNQRAGRVIRTGFSLTSLHYNYNLNSRPFLKTRQINKLAAFIALVSVCKQAQSTWTGLKAFKDKFTKFSTRVETLGRLKLQQEAGTTGIAAQKQACREQACSAAAVVAAAVRAWAEDAGNLTIAGKVNYSYSDLVGGRDTASQDRCQTVQDVAEEVLASLKDYGVDADVLEDLQEKIDAYAACISKPREAVATGKT